MKNKFKLSVILVAILAALSVGFTACQAKVVTYTVTYDLNYTGGGF